MIPKLGRYLQFRQAHIYITILLKVLIYLKDMLNLIYLNRYNVILKKFIHRYFIKIILQSMKFHQKIVVLGCRNANGKNRREKKTDCI